MGVSIREYARHRKVSDAAVRKALKQGRIAAEPDGSIDIEQADRAWATNTATPKTSPPPADLEPVPTEQVATVEDVLCNGEDDILSVGKKVTYMQARTANEIVKAHTNHVRLRQLKGEMVDRSEALAHVFWLSRQERDSWQTWPSRVASQMAADLNMDAHALHVALERYVRKHLEEIGAMAVTFKDEA